MVEVQNLSKRYGELWALQGTQWKVANKKTLGLLGPNGAGKSTTMKILTGLLRPTEGSVIIDGLDLLQEPISSRSLIGYLPEIPPVYEEMRVNSYLDFTAGLKGIPAKARKAMVDNVIERMSLGDVERRYIGQLSKGFRQRVGLAQALVANPPVLVLDEPSVGLDPQQVIELRELIIELKKDHTIILSTHVLSEVQQICDDVVILDRGKTVTSGPMEQILKRIRNRHGLKMVLSKISQNFIDEIQKMPAVESIQIIEGGSAVEIFSNKPIESLDNYVGKALEYNMGIVNIEKYKAHLEEAYMQITQGGDVL